MTVSDQMTVSKFIRETNERVSKGYIIAALTDEYIVDIWPIDSSELISKEEKILEIRVFDDKKECKLSRSNIGKEFSSRRICDAEEKRDFYDEWQFLDIDESMPLDEAGKVTATGGGKYKLPLKSSTNAKICIRYYLGEYEATGQARIEDWRVVEFKEGE